MSMQTHVIFVKVNDEIESEDLLCFLPRNNNLELFFQLYDPDQAYNT